MRVTAGLLQVILLVAVGCAGAPPPEAPGPAEQHDHADSDERAVEIAHAVLERLGGSDSWARTQYVSWKFFGQRMHYWDRRTGNIRIESPAREREDGSRDPERLILMNIHSKQGRAWEDGQEIRDPAGLAEAMQFGHEVWVNDSYWMFMPYKLCDPGVTLKYAGQRPLEDGRAADVLELTFAAVGHTPENRYEVFVARDTGLLEQWTYYASAGDEEAGFTLPWADWTPFGDIWLATNHGRGRDWQIAVHDALPGTVFSSPDPIQ